MLTSQQQETILSALDSFLIEIPSWAFPNRGTRFGKFVQEAAAVSTAEKVSDAGQVHAFTGCCPAVAVHVAWDFPKGLASAAEVAGVPRKCGVLLGAVNPTLFEEQRDKHGSFGSPDPAVRRKAAGHVIESIQIARSVGSRIVSLWFGDGSNHPGTANMRDRKQHKPFEPAFYHTDIAGWGMSFLLAKEAGPKAKVLVDTGHHYQAQNVEQIVAWLLDEEMLGGFHLNDRRYADDDLTLGSIDPHQVFRIFHEVLFYRWQTGREPQIACMIDQSHNLKPKIEERIRTVVNTRELHAKAAIVDHARLAVHRQKCSLIDAEETLRSALAADVRGTVREWRRSKGLPEDPLTAFRASGYLETVAAKRAGRVAALSGYC